MKFGAVILVNHMNSLSSVDYTAVTDALLSGGIFLDETVILPYNAPQQVSAALSRLETECGAVFVICDRPLLRTAREAVSAAVGRRVEEEFLFMTENTLFAVLPTGEAGAEIVKNETVPAVDRRRGRTYLRQALRAVGVPPETVQSALQKAREAAKDKLMLHVAEKYGVLSIELIYDQDTPRMTSDEVVRILATELKDYLYSLDGGEIAERLVEALKVRKMKIATAESFTGGGVGREIVRVPGASSVFYEGLNTYDSESKENRLGVSNLSLKMKGAVSDDVAYEMAAGLIKQGKVDLAVATTGFAGPESDGRLPVGLCYIAVGTKENVRVYRKQLSGDREKITETAIRLALFLAFKEIK